MLPHRTKEELESQIDRIRNAPKDEGALNLIVRRPAENEREPLEEGMLDLTYGLEGDNWINKPSSSTPDKKAHPEKQLNIMNSDVIEYIARDPERWALAGDQLYVDLDLSTANLPAGTQLSIGDAIIEVTPPAHLGCGKFIERFGKPAMIWVNSEVGRELNLRGICAKVIKPGKIQKGDLFKKL